MKASDTIDDDQEQTWVVVKQKKDRMSLSKYNPMRVGAVQDTVVRVPWAVNRTPLWGYLQPHPC